MDGRLIDFERGEEVRGAADVERLVEWTEPMRTELGLDVALPEANGAQRARRALEAASRSSEIYREAVDETRHT